MVIKYKLTLSKVLFKYHTTVVFLLSYFSLSYAIADKDRCQGFYQNHFNEIVQPTKDSESVINNPVRSLVKVVQGSSMAVPDQNIWSKFLFDYRPSSGNFTFSIKETRNIDQSTSRECFLFSYLSGLESAYANRVNSPKVLRFRPEFLLAKKFESVIGNLIEKYKQDFHFDLQGGEYLHAARLVKDYGLVPDDIWRPLVDYWNWDFEKIYEQIKSETDLVRNNIIKDPMYYYPKTKEDLKKEIFNKILGAYIGVMPKPFIFDGINHTTISFGRLYGQNTKATLDVKFMNSLGPLDVKKRMNFQREIFHIYGIRKKPKLKEQAFDEILDDIKLALSQGKLINLDVNGTTEQYGHSLVVVDMEVNLSGQIVAIKVKNTYKSGWGFNGYLWMSPKGLWEIFRRAWIIDINNS